MATHEEADVGGRSGPGTRFKIHRLPAITAINFRGFYAFLVRWRIRGNAAPMELGRVQPSNGFLRALRKESVKPGVLRPPLPGHLENECLPGLGTIL
jgi:hypothetical protein